MHYMLAILSFVYKAFWFSIKWIAKTTFNNPGDGVTFLFDDYIKVIDWKKKACFYLLDSIEETPTTQLKL